MHSAKDSKKIYINLQSNMALKKGTQIFTKEKRL